MIFGKFSSGKKDVKASGSYLGYKIYLDASFNECAFLEAAGTWRVYVYIDDEAAVADQPLESI